MDKIDPVLKDEGQQYGNIFFYWLMPCALEALTVIKTSCGRSTIPQVVKEQEKCKKPGLQIAFFLAHAVHARGSDGHQNVLWSVNYSSGCKRTGKMQKAGSSNCFLAHAVHARGSDGHQNVLWSISYSHVVREQVKSKKPGVFQSRNKTNPKHKHNPNKNNRKTPRKLSDTLRFQKIQSS